MGLTIIFIFVDTILPLGYVEISLYVVRTSEHFSFKYPELVETTPVFER